MKKHTTIFLLVFITFMTSSHAETFRERFRRYVLDIPKDAGSTRAFELDATAEQCMKCHDGSRGGHITIKSAESPMQYVGRQNVNHPVGMRYDTYSRRQPHKFVSENLLNSRIRLPEGRVSCVSCHVEKQAGRKDSRATGESGECTSTGELTAPIAGSRLCLSCHNM